MSASPSAYLGALGVLGPGLPEWPAAVGILRGEAGFEPAAPVLAAPTLLPPAERRRVGRVVKLALTVALEALEAAGADARSLPTVFTSSGGDGTNCHQLCETLASEDPQISPTRFHNSVHNAAAGYWSIATGATAPAAVLCAYDGSFAAGLLEALVQVSVGRAPCLLVAYDVGYPEPLRSVRPILDAFGVALLLTPEPGTARYGRLSASLSEVPAERLPDPALEALRQGIPAARSLPLLSAVARGRSRRIVLDYLPHARLAVDLAR